MESLFKLTELESRISLNMNVLVKGKVPKVLGLAEVLREWLDHRREVLVRRSKHRLAEIDHRLEVLGGLLVAYLNLDKVIKIIRNEDEPKPVLIKAFKLSDVQADAILNMRLRNLRKLEEMEIKRENKDLREEKAGVEKLIRSEKEQWKTVAGQIKEVRDAFSKKTPLGKRRTDFAEAPQHDEAAIEEAMVVREPITVVVSEKGWIRALRGHQTDLSGVAFKSDDGPKFSFPGRDHLEGSAVRHQRPLLHHRCVEAARRARPWRAGAALCRHRAGRRSGRGVALRRRPQVPGRQRERPRLRRQGGRLPRQHPQGQAGAQRQAAGQGARRSRRSRANWPRRSARTASSSFSRSIRCRRWRAAAACACSATRTAGSPT